MRRAAGAPCAARWLLAVLLAAGLVPSAAAQGSPATAAPPVREGLVAAPLGLAWGEVAEPAGEGTHAPGEIAEHLEFLLAHGWPVLRPGEAAAAAVAARPAQVPRPAQVSRQAQVPRQAPSAGELPKVVLTFDDPASARRYLLPLLELYRLPAVVTVSPEQAADPALAPALRELAASQWVELAPRVETRWADASTDLAVHVERLRALAGTAPRAVAWAPGAWSAEAERRAAELGLAVQLLTFEGIPPRPDGPAVSDGPRVPRYRVPPGAGVWALVQAGARWDPAVPETAEGEGP